MWLTLTRISQLKCRHYMLESFLRWQYSARRWATFSVDIFLVSLLISTASTVASKSLTAAPSCLSLEEDHCSSLSSFWCCSFRRRFTGELNAVMTCYVHLLNCMTCRLTIDADSEAWVGAWWLGPIVTSGFLVLTSVPMLGFPLRLPGTDAHCSNCSAWIAYQFRVLNLEKHEFQKWAFIKCSV